MYQPNPPVLSLEQLQSATQIEIAIAQYNFIVASVSLFYAILFFFILAKTILWIVPKYWYRTKDNG